MINTPILEKIRQEKLFYLSVNLWSWQEWPPKKFQSELEQIRELGFNTVVLHIDRFKDVEKKPGEYDWTNVDRAFDGAHRAGLRVIPYLVSMWGSGATPGEQPASLVLSDSNFEGISEFVTNFIKRFREHSSLLAWYSYGDPEPHSSEALSEMDQMYFAAWLEEQYGTLKKLNRAWDCSEDSFHQTPLTSFKDAAYFVRPIRNLRVARDLVRFQTEMKVRSMNRIVDLYRKHDPEHPVCTGSHHLLSSQAAHRWDWEEQAKAGDVFVGIPTLKHPQNLMKGEFDRSVYLQARMISDFFRGGWVGLSPVLDSFKVQKGVTGSSLTIQHLTRMLMVSLAAGMKGIGFWNWNTCYDGVNAGLQGVITLVGTVGVRGQMLSKLIKKIELYHEELWESEHEFTAGILYSWDNEALQYSTSLLKQGDACEERIEGTTRARIGASRAFLNGNLPFQYLTDQQFLLGDGMLFPVLYLPQLECLSERALKELIKYVDAGGRIIADMPCAMFNDYGRFTPGAKESAFEELFGVEFLGLVDSLEEKRTVSGLVIEGPYAELNPTHAEVVERMDDHRPAVLRSFIGQGSTTLIAFKLSQMCFNAGNQDAEKFLIKHAMADQQIGWSCQGALAFRLLSESVDHYFLINDGPNTKVAALQIEDRSYSKISDVLNETEIPITTAMNVKIPPHNAIWLRGEP